VNYLRVADPRMSRLLVLAMSAVLTACAQLPANDQREPTAAIRVTTGTRLSGPVANALGDQPTLSAFHPLGNGVDAFVARLAFAEYADSSIDLQYYLFHDDLSGRSLTAYLLDAADRGVRVRVLLDDMDMNGRDASLAALALHPNIAIRLFNPFPSRSRRNLNFLTHFGTVTRRMHNKAFIVDSQVAIVGGRNIGDEYFEAATGTNFGDMDLLALGPIVSDVSHSFDLYWNSDLAYSLVTLGANGDPILLSEARKESAAQRLALADSDYGKRLRDSNLANSLARGDTVLYRAPAELLYDLPEKVSTDPDDRSTHLGPELAELLASTKKQLIAISPYFVPGKDGARKLGEMAKSGVDVTVVTNSLASTDVPAVHAGYVRYRRALLEAGVKLYEVRPSPPRDEDGDRRFGTAQSSLHAKTFVIDGRTVVVGSMNMDPRSALLNTEMGIVIDSPELAALVEGWRRNDLPREAWRVTLEGLEADSPSSGGQMQWIAGGTGGEELVAEHEPEASLGRRIVASLLRWLPIEKQL
jgi:putative cardiolipin synthase